MVFLDNEELEILDKHGAKVERSYRLVKFLPKQFEEVSMVPTRFTSMQVIVNTVGV